ncbi:MAG TPA: hypothetical protein VJU61_09735 [Polyangiaceae bacterium]|nr:hypothetical protein [Polyangiaceae bacterium]
MKTLSSLVTPLSLLALGALAACGAEFDPGTQVSSLRVLAVQADTPYAHPGDTVRLQALSYDPLDRPITWAWAACPTPAGSSVDACLAQVGADAAAGELVVLAQGEGQDNIEITIPADALDGIPDPARPQALAGVLSIACPGELELGDLGTPLPFRCTDPGSGAELDLHDTVVGVKRVFLRENDVNQNPVIERVLFDGEEWLADDIKEVDACDTDAFDYDACKNADRHRIGAVVDAASFETGRDEFGGDFSEEVIVQHYATDGIFEDEVRIAEEPETGWVARTGSSGSEVSLWFVARDDRGGVSWTTRRVRVR